MALSYNELNDWYILDIYQIYMGPATWRPLPLLPCYNDIIYNVQKLPLSIESNPQSQTLWIYSYITEVQWKYVSSWLKCIFLNENVRISIKILLKFVTKIWINYFPPLVQIMAWRQTGDKPLSEPKMVNLRRIAYMGHSTSMSSNRVIHKT